ncbi:PDZ domain-containing protein [Intrasporangium sp.]|uniref:YlbL family protein n=1 Tax=Intrasporangium sp. TaxID=1925024 RepID=UPI002939D8B9|nr:S16 family serine protease [Intrasporangium sp.]MDV3220000.1 PDZ domain-containing protein [Intrasporangium sp.]
MKTIRRLAGDESAAPPLFPAPARQPAPLSRGNVIFLVGFFLGLAVLVVGNLVHVPFAIMSPGPTMNTLGEVPGEADGTSLISIDGLPTYEAEGELSFTTVSVLGGPGYPVDAFDVLWAWIDPSQDVLPVDEVFDPEASEERIAEENAIQMEGSQEEATAVALRALGQKVTTHIAIVEILDDSRARDALRPGDRIVRVGDTKATTADSVRGALQAVRPGEEIEVEVTRSGKQVVADVPTTAGAEGRTALGVLLQLDYDFPATVTINAGDVGGPSAGLMFALGVYDKLTPDSLTNGRDVAGTGTIADDGAVGPIGGIKQKMAGARSGGSEYFLAPRDNCPEVVGNVPAGLEVFAVDSFAEATRAVEGIASGRTSSLGRC